LKLYVKRPISKGTPKEQLFDFRLEIGLAAHDLGRVDSLHFIHPARSRNNLPNRARLVGCVTRDTDIVVALENQLNVADIELW
jgi:hypothetical protein